MARGERVKAQGRSRNRKDAILDEATRLFAERGFEGTSMSDLAEQVGLRKASLFHHFASKEDLRRAVVQRVIARALPKLQDQLQAGEGAEAFDKSVTALSDAIVCLLSEDRYAARLLLREAMEWVAGSKGGLGEAFADSLDVGHRFIVAAQRAGLCADDDAKQLVATLVGIHIVPFALGTVMERFTGNVPWSEPFISERRTAVKAHVHALLQRRANGA